MNRTILLGVAVAVVVISNVRVSISAWRNRSMPRNSSALSDSFSRSRICSRLSSGDSCSPNRCRYIRRTTWMRFRGSLDSSACFRKWYALRVSPKPCAEAISKFQNMQTGYDAALKSYSMVQRLSLFEYLRT